MQHDERRTGRTTTTDGLPLPDVLEAFQAAIRPRRVDGAARQERLAAFIRKYPWDDERVVTWVVRVLGETPPPRFFEAIPVSRIRTFDEALLRQVWKNFREWHPVLTAESGACSRELSALIGQIAEHPRGGWGQAAWQDAVSDAFVILWRTAGEPYAGYVYEGDLRAWIKATAKYRLLSRARAERREQRLDEGAVSVELHRGGASGGETPVALGSDDGEIGRIDGGRRLEEMRGRLLLVETTFRGGGRGRVVIQAMLEEAQWGAGRAPTTAELRDRIHAANPDAGVPNAKSVQTTVRHVRQRLRAVEFVRDVAPTWLGPPDDAALVTHMYPYRAPSDGLETFWRLAALARAVDGGDLRVAVAAKLMLAPRTPPRARAVRARLGLGRSPEDRHVEQVIALAQWCAATSERQRILSRHRRDRFAIPVWILVVAYDLSDDEVIARLMPFEDEVEGIMKIVSDFRDAFDRPLP